MEKQIFFDAFDIFYKQSHLSTLVFSQQSGHSVLFSSLLLQHISHQNLNVQILNLDQNKRDEVHHILSMKYLGESIYYLLKGFCYLSVQEQEKWTHFIVNYQGPHRLILFISPEFIHVQSQFCMNVKIPETVTPAELLYLSQYFDQKHTLASIARLAHIIEQYVEKIKFDTAVMLIYYASVLSPRLIEQFILIRAPHFLYDEQSLFILADAFFAREKKFFLLWNQVFDKYSVQFWINFWMDSAGKAALYCHYKRIGEHDNAKTISHRLPFGFINKNWKSHLPKSLINLHE